jgi:hypothetical protein
MSEETIQNQYAPLTLTNEIIISTAGATSLLSRAHDTLGRPVGTYLRDVPSSAPAATARNVLIMR